MQQLGNAIHEAEDRLKQFISLRRRRQLALLRLRVRMFTAERRRLPNTLIIGAQRCGTSSLYKYLSRHPLAVPSLRKEVGYFSVAYHRGERWYRAHYPPKSGHHHDPQSDDFETVCIDATPDYLLDPRAARRAADLIPDARVLVLLRDPVDRAISHYEHACRHGHETETLERAIELEASRLDGVLARVADEPTVPLPATVRNFSYLTRGHYSEQLVRWFHEYPRSAIMVIRSEDLFSDPPKVFAEVLSFLQLPSWQPPIFKNYSYVTGERPEKAAIPPSIRMMLSEYFAPRNEMLCELVRKDFGWSGVSNDEAHTSGVLE